MGGKTFTVANSSRRVPGVSLGDEPFYVFNAREGGFVIVSGDDRTREILGYSPTGTLEMDSLPANLQWWLGEYARQIDALGTSTVAVKPSKLSAAPAVSPMIQTLWSQEGAYNLMCPDRSGTDYGDPGYDASNRCVTGCVATAMAQVMNYWQWPESCPELPAYTTRTDKWAIKSLPSTTFKWGLMKNRYYSETGDSAYAVAELMRYCGQAIHMNYTPSLSGGSVSREDMVETFNYSPKVSEIERDSYDLATWENIIYNEVAEGRPVLYEGFTESDHGHEFVVDGFDSNGLFHINWGWWYHDGGYYVLSVADPSDSGTTDTSNVIVYKRYQRAIIGIKPPHEPYAVLSDDGLTVTFYYDVNRFSRKGLDIGYNHIMRTPYYTAETAVFDDSFADYIPNSTSMWFYSCSDLKEIKGFSNLNIDNVTDMSSMFSGCSGLTSLDLSSFKTDNVTNMEGMFSGCSSLTSLDLSSFKTDNVTNMSSMFSRCSSLTSLDLSGFKTDNVKVMRDMFRGCYDLTSLDLSGFKTDNVTDMSGMFRDCSHMTSLDLSRFKTDNVTDMNGMFNRSYHLTSVDLSSFKTGNVTDMSGMFNECYDLTSLDLSSFKTDNVTDMSDMFNYCYNLETIYVGDGWSTEKVTSGSDMFEDCYKLEGGKGTKFDWSHTDYTYARIDGGPDAPGYFRVLGQVPPRAYATLSDDGLTVTFYYDNQNESRGGIDINNSYISYGSSSPYGSATTAVIDASFADYRPTSTAYWFQECSSLTAIIGMENLKTDYVTDMEYMFYNCSSLTSLDLSGFKTDNVTDMGYMFSGCYDLTSLDLSGFKTDNVWHMGYMFCGCSSLTTLDLSSFKTDNVTNMSDMFSGCSSLTSLDLSSFKTDNMWNMNYMFYGCSGLTSLDLSSFNTGNVRYMGYMFRDCLNLETIYAGDGWSTENVTYGNDMFEDCYKLVGGQGTIFDWSHTDHTYARIDGGPDAPGYFTYKNPNEDAIGSVKAENATDIDYYDIDGRKLNNTQRGVNIIRHSDGKSKKVLVK